MNVEPTSRQALLSEMRMVGQSVAIHVRWLDLAQDLGKAAVSGGFNTLSEEQKRLWYESDEATMAMKAMCKPIVEALEKTGWLHVFHECRGEYD